MNNSKLIIFLIFNALVFFQCNLDKSQKKKNTTTKDSAINNKQEVKSQNSEVLDKELEEKKSIILNDKNAIPFFFQYQKENLENSVRISTRFGNIDIQLFENTPYHRANFIYLTKKGYFNNTTFHRVVHGFIIQGGNSDRYETAKKRGEIGKYLLPPDTRKGYSHHKGVIAMPSSEIENPYKLASPYEFFIVQQSPGAYHLDGSYTIFGKVIAGMEVVDIINKQKTDKRETPLTNIFMDVSILEK